MATYVRTFTASGTVSSFTAFTNPNNAQKTSASTSTYADGTVTNSRNIGNAFTFGNLWDGIPAGMEVKSVTVVTAKYASNTSQANFNVGTNNLTSPNLINADSGGSANAYIESRIAVPKDLYTIGQPLTLYVGFKRTGGNNLTVRMPYLYIEVEYGEPQQGLNIFSGTSQTEKIYCGDRDVVAVDCGNQKIM